MWHNKRVKCDARTSRALRRRYSKESMYKYRIHYLADMDDANWKTYESNEEVKVGDVLELACGLFHMVVAIRKQKTGTRIDVSRSSQDPEEARSIAVTLGHYKKD